jgi:hypothetical protein
VKKITVIAAAAAAAAVVTGCSSAAKPAAAPKVTCNQNAAPLRSPAPLGSFDGVITLKKGKAVKGSEVFTSAPLSYAQLMASGPGIFTLAYTGPVATTGTFDAGSTAPVKGQKHLFRTAAGNFTAVVKSVPVHQGSGRKLAALNARACRYGAVTQVDFALIPADGTGKWKHLSGTGTVVVRFEMTFPEAVPVRAK